MKKIIRNNLFNLSLIVAIAALTACGGGGTGGGSVVPTPITPITPPTPSDGTTCTGTKTICVSANTSLPILSKAAPPTLDKTLGATGGTPITFTSSESVAAPVTVKINVESGGSFISLSQASCTIAKGASTCNVSISVTASATSTSTSTLGYSTAGGYNMKTAKQTFTFAAVPTGVIRSQYPDFPVTNPTYTKWTGSTTDLTHPIIYRTIISSILGGVIYAHLINNDKIFNKVQVDDYLHGALFGQLLQESGMDDVYLPDFKPDDPDQVLHNTSSNHIHDGSGGPYQLNNYMIKMPDNATDGALGLLNYNALYMPIIKSDPSFTISNVYDAHKTTDQGAYNGPSPAVLNNLYVAPVMAAYFHYNDFHSYKFQSDGSGKVAKLWFSCMMGNAQKPEYKYITNIIMNGIYNAGTNPPMDAYVSLCNNPTDKIKLTQLLVNNYGLNDSDFMTSLGVGGEKTKTDEAYMKYPRQINFIVDQLYNDNDSLGKFNAGKNVNNSVHFAIEDMKQVFRLTMQQLSYKSNNAGNRILIKPDDADTAFEYALKKNSMTDSSKYLSLTNDASGNNDRAKIFTIFGDAIGSLESTLKFKFSDVSDKD